MKLKPLILLLFLLLAFQETIVVAQPGALDPGFGNAGLVSTFVNSRNDQPFCSAIQSDGKILVAGYAYYDTVASKYGFSIVRYNIDGSIDSSFNGTGRVLTVVSGSTRSGAYTIALQPDLKILLAGFATIGSGKQMAMVRYLPDGNVDSTFGLNGMVTTAIGTIDDRSTSMLLHPDGKIVIAGFTKNASNVYDFAIARYDSTGVLDTTFSNDGINTTSFNGNNATSNSIAVQQDGTYYVFGSVSNISTLYFAMTRYFQDGSLDTSFGTNGIASYSPGTGFTNSGIKVLIQPDKKILLYGNAEFSSVAKMVVLRFDSTCSFLDVTFGNSGKATIDFTYHAYGASDIALQPDGKIVVTGQLNNVGVYDFALARLNSDGLPDSTFGTNGKVITTFGSNDDTPVAINIQSDGKIVIAGNTEFSNSVNNFALARYFGDVNVGLSSPNASNSEVIVYPNPVTNNLNIRLNTNEPTTIIVYDLVLKEQLQQSFISSTAINTGQLSYGMYLYELRNSNGIIRTGKFIKQ